MNAKMIDWITKYPTKVKTIEMGAMYLFASGYWITISGKQLPICKMSIEATMEVKLLKLKL
jgi:YHS domain-containing protein